MRERVVHAARDCGLDLDVCRLERGETKPEAVASALGCSESELVRSVVYVADGEPVVCVVRSGDEIDAGGVCDALDCAAARPASPAEARAATGFPSEFVPPLAHDVRILLDTAVADQPRVFACGGDGRTRLALAPGELVAVVGATLAQIAR